jgi:hypothetical protein
MLVKERLPLLPLYLNMEVCSETYCNPQTCNAADDIHHVSCEGSVCNKAFVSYNLCCSGFPIQVYRGALGENATDNFEDTLSKEHYQEIADYLLSKDSSLSGVYRVKPHCILNRCNGYAYGRAYASWVNIDSAYEFWLRKKAKKEILKKRHCHIVNITFIALVFLIFVVLRKLVKRMFFKVQE